MKAIIALFIIAILGISAQDYCSEVNSTALQSLALSCQAEITTIMGLSDTDASLLANTGCSASCRAKFLPFRRYVGCSQVIEYLGAGTPFQIDAATKVRIVISLDAKCAIDINPPRPVLSGGAQIDLCPAQVKADLRTALTNVWGNCTKVVSGLNMTCDGQCLTSVVRLQKLLFLCRDEYRFLDEVVYPTIRDGLRFISQACEAKRRIEAVADCASRFNASIEAIRKDCDGQVCTQTCKDSFVRNGGIIERCIDLFTRINTNPLNDLARQFIRRVRFICNIRSLDLNVSVSSDGFSVQASDTLDPAAPLVRISLEAQKRSLLIERYLSRQDTAAVNKFRIIFRKLVEFVPRNDSLTDMDFVQNGFDPEKDLTVNEQDFENTTFTDVRPLEDLGSNDLDVDDQSHNQSAGFQRVIRSTIRFGPLKVSRLVLSFVLSNVRNAKDLAQVLLPGGVNFNAIFDNIPFTRDGSHIAFVIDIESDKDLNITRHAEPIESDPSLPNFSDNGETVVNFNDSRRIRYRRIAFCENNVTLIVKERIVIVQVGGVTYRRLIVTYFFENNNRCSKLLFDPTVENNVPDQQVDSPSSSVASNPGTSASQSTGKASTGNAAFLCFSAIFALLALLF